MMAEGLWKVKSRRRLRIHQRRPRRACFGELIQIDGSPHAWFEDRGKRCTLIVFIDDATGRLLYLRFVAAETTQAYMEALGVYLGRYGRPVALYSDRHSIFRVNHGRQEGKVTQFTRAVKTLDIEPIHANTPQAKGRVERANQTLQDRLVKELRLAGIDGMEAGNDFLPAFMADYNRRFAVAPKSEEDAHRAVLQNAEELDLILRRHETRKLSKNLTFQYLNREYQITGRGKGYRLRGASVAVCDAFGAGVKVLHKGRSLTFRVLAEGEPPVALDDEKSVPHTVDEAQARQRAQPGYKPPLDHPWNRLSAETLPPNIPSRDHAAKPVTHGLTPTHGLTVRAHYCCKDAQRAGIVRCGRACSCQTTTGGRFWALWCCKLSLMGLHRKPLTSPGAVMPRPSRIKPSLWSGM